MNLVPWSNLKAGDTVRVHYQTTPYKVRFRFSGAGTAAAPIRLCGVKGPNGERPILDGSQATAVSGSDSRALIYIASNGGVLPTHLQIDGFAIQKVHPDYGHPKFGACIFIAQGHNITIADNEISDCNQAIFSTSVDGSENTVSKNLRISGNNFFNNGINGSALEHTTYIQTVGVIYEFNRYGPLRSGAIGNSIKDRSTDVIIRFNRIEAGTRSMDLVDAEEYKEYARANAKYPFTYIYGNQIFKNGREVVHYGGDHPGFENYYRKGRLYFFNNTVIASGNAKLFMIATLDETVEAWNNIFYFSSGTPLLREVDGYYSAAQSGGTLILGKNWINTGYKDSNTQLARPVMGTANLITGATAPINMTSLNPTPGGQAVDAGQAAPAAAAQFILNYQLLPLNGFPISMPREVKGAAIDLGAVE